MKQKLRNIVFPLSILYIAAILNLFNLRSARMLFRHTVLDFQPCKPVTLQVDASHGGLGACLIQEGHPVIYAS
jgi:hypothetical protein